MIFQQFEKTSLSSLLEASVSAKGASMFLFVTCSIIKIRIRLILYLIFLSRPQKKAIMWSYFYEVILIPYIYFFFITYF